MTGAQLLELGYIVPIATVPSILEHGILSHNRAAKLKHEDIAMQEVNDYRATVIVPTPRGGRKLHDYANLYICSRNPMLLKRSNMREQLCVLRVRPTVIEIDGVVVTDGNAGSKYTRNFKPAPEGLSIVNYERTFADGLAPFRPDRILATSAPEVRRSTGAERRAHNVHHWRVRLLADRQGEIGSRREQSRRDH